MLGSGPGGYTAAFRAADLGKKVVLVERDPTLGGVCLNVGCIPSKALLHAAKVISEAEEMGHFGVKFAKPEVDVDGLRGWKESVVKKLTGGLSGLAKGRKVTVVEGVGTFTGPNAIRVEGKDGAKTVSFDQCIIAAGSEPVKLPFIPDDPRVIDSTGALELQGVPKRLLVIGGGIIGLEMATVYDALGTKVTIVELMDQIIPGADADVVKPLHKRIEKRYEAIHLKAKVTGVKALETGLEVAMEGPNGAFTDVFDRVLVAVGRRPNGKVIGAEAAGVTVDERGFIPVDNQHADQRAAYLRDRRRGRPADAGAQGGARGQGGGRGGGRVEPGVRRAGDPVGRLHRPRGRLGRDDRERGEGEGRQGRQGGVPLGGLGAVAVASGATRASPRCCSTRPTTG